MLLSSGNSWAGRLFRLVILPMLASAAFAQTCVPNATPLPMHPEGLAEKLGDVVITCTGGPNGGVVAGSLFIAYNTPVSNRNDGSANPVGVTAAITGVSGSVTTPALNNPTLLFISLQYTIAATPATITISGVRSAPSSATPGSNVTAVVTLTGVGSPAQGIPFVVGTASPSPSLLGTVFNNGLPCGGSALPN